MSKIILIIVLILASIKVSWLNAQENAKQNKSISSDTNITKKMESNSYQDTQQSIKMDVAILKEKVDTISSMMTLFITVLLGILTIGGIASSVGWSRTDKRTREAFDLGIAGERASQKRAEDIHLTFLEGSKTTLGLVNETLTLAKEASERAAKSIETKAITTLDDLDKKSKALIARDIKRVIAEPALRSKLHSLAQKIAGFEINLFILPPEFKLTPDCLFIRGMDFHLNQQFDEALDCWDSVALHQKTPKQLKSSALYWIGCENNNLGKFSDACKSFDAAFKITSKTDVQRFELQRIIIESKFFDKKNEKAKDLIEPLGKLLSSIEKDKSGDEDIKPTRAKILTTLGNVYFQVGNELRKNRNNAEAKKNYGLAEKQFRKVTSQNKWALFGLAETLHRLGKQKEAKDIFEKIRLEATDEYIRKEEPRGKVQACTSELVCCLRIRRFKNERPVIHSQVIEALGRVDEQLTVYSQMQKRNVSKDEFKKDLDNLMAGRD
jgi:tetratricopeptide (TPR) repeat protein